MDTRATAFQPDYAIPPGEILEETLEARGIKKTDFAARCGRPAKTISEIIAGKAAITPETAIQFERVLGIPAGLWTNLENQYRLKLAEIDEQRELSKHADWAKQFPLSAMKKFGLIAPAKGTSGLVEQLLDFLAVGSVNAWNKRFDEIAVAYRRSQSFKSAPESLAVWLQWGEKMAERVGSAAFDPHRFREVLQTVRPLTREPLDVWKNRVPALCRDVGVVVVFVPELPKTHLCGATRWLTKDKALVQLSLRHKTDDHLWFTFFHEAGHVLLHGKRDVFIDEISSDDGDVKEREANRFASDLLIPPEEWQRFIARGVFSLASVRAFAQSVDIAPGIVVGRLQHEKHVPFSHLNGLKERYEWTIDADHS